MLATWQLLTTSLGFGSGTTTPQEAATNNVFIQRPMSKSTTSLDSTQRIRKSNFVPIPGEALHKPLPELPQKRPPIKRNPWSLLRNVRLAISPNLNKIPKPRKPPKFDKTRLKIFVGTWNMMGQLPPHSDGLDSFLDRPTPLPHAKPYPQMNVHHPYHIIVVGTQECERDIKESMLFPSKEEWERRLLEWLQAEYTMVQTETMTALHIAVFVWNRVKHMVKAVDSHSVATGIGGILGNKGAVGVSMLFGDVSLLFINSHLTSDQDHVLARNHDYKRICRELNLDNFSKNEQEPENVTDRFDYTFWFGDLNYRVNGTRDFVDLCLKRGSYKVLLENDQLNIARKSKQAFEDFHEAPITFPPTYKFDPLTEPTHSSVVGQPPKDMPPPPKPMYDTSNKTRIPSWCDRILWKTTVPLPPPSPGSKGVAARWPVEVRQYVAHMNIGHFSDHRPVTAVFTVKFDWQNHIRELGGTVVQDEEDEDSIN